MPIRPTPADRIRSEISTIFRTHAGISPARTTLLLPFLDLQGKLYEAKVLACILRDLVTLEGCVVQLQCKAGSTYRLKQKGSPILHHYPYFQVFRGAKLFGEVFTDTEFSSLSCLNTHGSVQSNADYHELDIVMFTPGQNGRPFFDTIMLAIECKATKFEKSTFRELLGYRRELGYYSASPNQTYFDAWPTFTVQSDNQAECASVHMCYSTDSRISKFTNNAEAFGILLVHEPI